MSLFAATARQKIFFTFHMKSLFALPMIDIALVPYHRSGIGFIGGMIISTSMDGYQ